MRFFSLLLTFGVVFPWSIWYNPYLPYHLKKKSPPKSLEELRKQIHSPPPPKTPRLLEGPMPSRKIIIGLTFEEEPTDYPEEVQETTSPKWKRDLYRHAPVSRPPSDKSENFNIIKVNASFADIGGNENLKLEMTKIVDMMKNYKKYKKYGADIPVGILFQGLPGTGKTLFARVIAGESKMNALFVSGSQFVEKYVGVGASRIREFFELARKNTPCILFIDEVDAVGAIRSDSNSDGSSERDSTLNELLVQLDGAHANANEGLFVIMATNRPDKLDSALLRPGRIDKRITIPLPDENARKQIIEIYGKNKKFHEGVDWKEMIKETVNLSGAQIKQYLNGAIIHAIFNNNEEKEGHGEITKEDLAVSLNEIYHGSISQPHNFTQNMWERIAVHELGHAWLALQFEEYEKIDKVCLNPNSPIAVGSTHFLIPDVNKVIKTQNYFLHKMIILLGGRLSEEFYYDSQKFSTGAEGDLKEVKFISNEMVSNFGMTQNGELFLSTSHKKLEKEQENWVRHAHDLGKKSIQKSRNFIDHFLPILLKEKYINGQDLYDWCQP